MPKYYRYYNEELSSVLFFLLKQYYFGFLQVAMSLLKYFCNDSSKEVPAPSSAHKPFPAKRQKTIPKRRKWNEDYINYGFFRPKGKKENSYSPVQCMFCLTIYGNANVTPSKLISHFTKQHSEHQNKSEEFFQSHRAAQKKQSNLFDKQMGLQSTKDKNLPLASLKMSHHVMNVKRPYKVQNLNVWCYHIWKLLLI